ncbi:MULTISPECIES: LysE family translocator [Thalassospira]|jgi:homoserine/homoserine lactone efflux protein|uniref:Threonine transporter RhtB n=2 Tax=Thalassospira tepidiphila TaxID=393657 RepID=A0A853KWP9_9PROT|nr:MULTISPECIES: LysE family translocator [Thalassospira]KXJ56961.1 MAG: threonine transporter RhtB [Thalassospira sp. Nap_22]MBO6580239.1 LysE family translocator [Thalassospira sp.]MBO6804117.1 LysE family translocator [Thalassospira sp.]MBO6819964.1 LysE family translocator [Thalassospira sp.]MBO6889599.1 LysE family translocator [Thalassospira sp.]
MLSLSLIGAFIPTAFFVSITPGMCMTLALTLGMTIGLKRTLWMMVGELIGVGIVVVASALGVAAIMLQYPAVFAVFKYIGGAYLAWLGIQLWRSRGRMAISGEVEGAKTATAAGLAAQGFVTAIANPKGWAFMISLLPPFISLQHPIAPQLSVLVAIILVTELICMTMYATGGRSLRRFLEKSGNVRILNRVAGTLMIGVGIWLASS